MVKSKTILFHASITKLLLFSKKNKKHFVQIFWDLAVLRFDNIHYLPWYMTDEKGKCYATQHYE